MTTLTISRAPAPAKRPTFVKCATAILPAEVLLSLVLVNVPVSFCTERLSEQFARMDFQGGSHL